MNRDNGLMRVVQVLPYPADSITGVGRMALSLAEGLREAGHTIDILEPPDKSKARSPFWWLRLRSQLAG